MFDIGFSEILIIATLTLIVMGPNRLPETIKTITLWIGRLRNFINSARSDIENEVGIDEIKKQLHNEKVMQEIAKTKAELNSVTQDLSSDKKDAKFPDDSPAFEVALPILFPKDFASPPANGIIKIANKANFQFW